MTKDEESSELGAWFLAWWKSLAKHKSLFSGKSLGSREKAWLEIKKIKPDGELKAILVKYTREKAEICHSMRNAGKTVSPWKDVERLVKYRFWDDDLPERAAKVYQKKDKICGAHGCNAPATNAGKLGVFFCVDHWDGHDPERADMLREHFISLGIRQDENGWKGPCMAYMKRLGGFGGLVGNG